MNIGILTTMDIQNGRSLERYPAVPRGGLLWRRAFHEHVACMRDVQTLCARYLHTPSDTPAGYAVAPAAIPRAFFGARRNLFSTLFLSVYHLLDIPRERRLLYGRINHLFRIWVTAADNLLDDEDKVVIPLHMPGSSRIMRQVVTIMAADRVLKELLDTAVDAAQITAAEADALSEHSLRQLLPSAAQEATEEGGIVHRPPPHVILETIHRHKTGLLFQIPFMGPDLLERHLDPRLKDELKQALMQFGLGCQLLDDIRDMARDLVERRHNYVLSWLAHRKPDLLLRLSDPPPAVDDRLYLRAPGACGETARQALHMMTEALSVLGREGLGLSRSRAEGLAKSMFRVLDLGGLTYA
jgi:hypothetical protein